jgi:hypothetical protein
MQSINQINIFDEPYFGECGMPELTGRAKFLTRRCVYELGAVR